MGINKPFRKAFTENKKGLFFASDAFIALMLFIIILLGVYSYVIVSNNMQQQYYFSEDLLDVFSNIKLNELDSGKYLFIIGFSEELTIAEVIVQNPTLVEDIIQELTGGLINQQYGVGVYIDGDLVYTDLEDVRSSVSRTKLIKNSEGGFSELTLEVGVKS